VDGVAFGGVGRFHDCFAEGRVGVDGGTDFLVGRFQSQGQAEFGDHFCGIAADDVGTQQLAVFRAEEKFYEAFVIGDSLCFARCAEREFARFVSDMSFFESGFR